MNHLGVIIIRFQACMIRTLRRLSSKLPNKANKKPRKRAKSIKYKFNRSIQVEILINMKVENQV